MTEDQKKAEVDAFLAEKDAMKRLKLEKIIAGQIRPQSVETLVSALTGALIGAVLGAFGSKGDIHLPILGVVVALACAVGVNRWLGARRVNRQIAALKEYLDLRLVQIERGGATARDN